MAVNLPWVEKYRPQQLTELVAHQEIVKTLDKFIENRTLPHLLFYGPPGTGKTTSILAAARKMYPKALLKSMVLELNASNDRGIDVVRNNIVMFAQTKSLHSENTEGVPFKLVILDEADAMTKDAQNALRRIVEKYTSNVRFCIICNYLSSIIPAIQSRCTRFRFAPLEMSLIEPRLIYVAEQENLKMLENGKKSLLKVSNGDMRTVLNTLQSTAMSFDVIDESSVYQCIGQPTPGEINRALNILLNDNAQDCIKKIKSEFFDKGYALQDLITHLHDLVYTLDLPDDALEVIICGLGEVEESLSVGCSNDLQLAGVVSVFFKAKGLIRSHAA